MKAYFKQNIFDGERVVWFANKGYDIISETDTSYRINTELNQTNYAIVKNMIGKLFEVRQEIVEINKRETNRKERAKAEMERCISRYDEECGEVVSYKVDPEELKNYYYNKKLEESLSK